MPTFDEENKSVVPTINPFTDMDEDVLWLELGKLPDKVANPLETPIGFKSDPVDDMVRILCNKEYLHFAARMLLNVELLPFQCVILDTLWTKRFPLLIASRGGSKSYCMAVFCLLRMIFRPGCKIVIVGNGLRQARQVFDYMATIWDKAPILRDIAGRGKTCGPRREVDRFQFEIGDSRCWAIPLGQGDKIRGMRADCVVCDEFSCLEKNTLVETDKGIFRIHELADYQEKYQLFTGENKELEAPTKFIKTPLTDVYQIKTRHGVSFKCSEIHQVMTTNGWKLAKDLTTKDWIIADNQYKFPEQQIKIKDITLDENLAWIMGILVSEGSINDKHSMNVHMTDQQCIERLGVAWKKVDPDINVCFYEREERHDSRGWTAKKSYVANVCKLKLRDELEEFGLLRAVVHDKTIPWSILRSPRSVVISFLKGLFEGDGTCFQYDGPKKREVGIAYYSVSEQLCSEVQFLLSKLGIDSYKHDRASKLSDKRQWFVRLRREDCSAFLDMVKIDKWQSKLLDCPLDNRRIKEGCVFQLPSGNYSAGFSEYGKINHIGTFATQKEAFEKLKIAISNSKRALQVVEVKKLDKQDHLYDFYLPKSHSFYGNGFRQHNSINEEVFNVVVRGFAAVSADPKDKVKQAAMVRKLKELGQWTEELEEVRKGMATGNQIICSGTAFYAFNHFYKQWKIHHAILTHRGDPKKIQELFGDDSTVSKGFRWTDYSILRIPYTALPEGFLDDGILSQAKASMSNAQFMMEYAAIFPVDSDGFYRRSTLEACTVNKPIMIGGELVQFSAMKQGEKDKVYTIGVDPAAESDNAAIVILELHKDYRKIVSCWTTNRKKYGELKKRMAKEGTELDDDYYRYIGKKIREFMRSFNTEHIIMDKNGGGIAIAESLATRDACGPTEFPIFEMIDIEDPKENDGKKGLHILELITPTSDINTLANHGMLKDFQDKVLLFPLSDSVELAKSIEIDHINETRFDNFEDLLAEIEELKNEITSIIVTPSSSLGKETFDTPNTKQEGTKRVRGRKDRYSALLYANYYARNKDKQGVYQVEYRAVGTSTKTNTTATIEPENRSLYYGIGTLRMKNGERWINGGGGTYIKHGL